MIWILLAALGIPLWMIVGLLIGAGLSRRAFKRAPGVFPAKLQAGSVDVEHVKRKWPRRACYVRWVHDVILVQRGIALARTDALPIARAKGSVDLLDSDAIRGLGAHPLVVTMVLDDGTEVQLAAPAEFRDTMVGPFLGVAAMSSLSDC
jgi:hypothetical protein